MPTASVCCARPSTAPNPKVNPSAKRRAPHNAFSAHVSPLLLAALADLLKEMLELASRWAVHLASPRNRIEVRSSEYKSARNAVELHFCGVPAAVYFVGAVSGKVTNIGSAKTATTAIMAPGTMIQPVRSVRTWAT